MDKIVFLPCPENYDHDVTSCAITRDDQKNKNQPVLIGRDNLTQLYSENEATGWWFNLPIAGYPWMSADLERLLTGYLDEENKTEFKGLDGWPLDSWMELIQNLAKGLIYLHQKGGVHGDIRPANIMANVYEDRNLMPDQFKWIDVGVANDDFSEFSDDKKMSITHAPLGDERKTPFYARERNEVIDLEDADIINIKKSETGIVLSFSWRRRTTDDHAVPLKIREKGYPIRELGKLRAGDRIQVREFLFDVKAVDEAEIKISNVYEIGFGCLLIHKTGGDLDNLVRRLNGAPISKYRIYKQWSQATDIYGFGVVILYLFYMRGLYFLKSGSKPAGNKEAQPNIGELSFNRLRREKTFEEFIKLLKSRSFLEIFSQYLISNEIEEPENIWQLVEEQQIRDKLSDISEILMELDPTSGLILYGASSYRLFTQIIYLCLCCLWRKDEVEEIIPLENSAGYHKFNMFCDNRFKISGKNQQRPATELKDAIDQIIKFSHKNEYVEMEGNRDRAEIGTTWQKRMANLRETVGGLEKTTQISDGEKKALSIKVEDLNAEKNVIEINLRNLENENNTLKSNLECLTDENLSLQEDIEKLTLETYTLGNENSALKMSGDKVAKNNDTSKIKHFIIDPELDKLRKDIKNKRHVFQDLAEQFSTTLSGAYKRHSVDQFVEEVFIYLSQISKSISNE